MTVFVVAQITISDREEYALYEAGFLEIFQKYEGTMLSVDENPAVIEGAWNATRSVIISFPSSDAFRAWNDSDEYQEIAKHRYAAAVTHSIISKGLDEMIPSA